MDNKDNHESVNNRTTNNTNRNDNNLDEISRYSRRGGDDVGLTDRLTEILVGDGDGDLLLEQSDGEDNLLQWLQALEMQVMGACRADERLKPLLKRTGSGGVADDTLLAHLSQHFEPSEVAMLARCLCVPLVTISVGKVNQQGTRLCPTNTR